MAELKSTRAFGSLRVDGTLLDSSGSAGTSGQVLSSVGAGTSWTTTSGGANNSISEYAQFFGTGANASVYLTTEAEVDWMSTSASFSNGTWSNNGTRITVPITGVYLIATNWYLSSTTGQRSTIRIRLSINGTGIDEFCRHTYIRNAESHQNSSANMQTLLYLTANDTIAVMSIIDAGDNGPSLELVKTQSSISVVRMA